MIIVAELSCNHEGSLDRACMLVEAAAAAGADAIKLQTFAADSMAIANHTIASGPWAGRNLRDLYKEAETPLEWHQALFELAWDKGMDAFSTPFDLKAVEFLESIGCPAYKISSFEITDLELIRACAATGKQMYISTGMATEEEIYEAAEAAKDTDFTFLKCTSAYPAPYEDCNLRTMLDIKKKFGSVGLSDHTLGYTVPVAAVALGALIVEKHLTLSKESGLDAGFSMLPHEFKQMVDECRNAELAMGAVRYGHRAAEQSSFELRRSLYFAKDMKRGDIITRDCLTAARPNLGMSPSKIPDLLHKCMHVSASAGDPVCVGMVNG